VLEPPSDRIRRDPSLIDDIKTFCSNLAQWLSVPVAAR